VGETGGPAGAIHTKAIIAKERRRWQQKYILQKGTCCDKVYEIRELAGCLTENSPALSEPPEGSVIVMEPVMCPFCGGTNLYQDDDFGLELDEEYWTIHHWECMDCAQSFDKIDILPASNAFEEMNESTIH
jgi:hypothetical protein